MYPQCYILDNSLSGTHLTNLVIENERVFLWSQFHSPFFCNLLKSVPHKYSVACLVHI